MVDTVRKPYITAHRYREADNQLVPVSGDQYQAQRSRGDRPIKQRPDIFQDLPVRITRSTDITARSDLRRSHILQDGQLVKVIGYSVGTGCGPGGSPASAASTGTSRPNVLCVTDGMSPCIAVAVGGETEQNPDGARPPGSKVRVFHAFTRNSGAPKDIREYVDRLRGAGLAVKAALHGGNTSPRSKAMAAALRGVLAECNVEPEFDEACERRGAIQDRRAIVQGANTPLGAVVTWDNRVRFVTNLIGAIR